MIAKLAMLTLCGLALTSSVISAEELSLSSFGWGLNKAAGTRPLLVIWAREPDDASVEKLARYRQYYQDLVLGRLGPATSQAQPNAGGLSVVEYYAEISEGRFGWNVVGFVGPVTAKVKIETTRDIARLAIEAAAKDAKFNFRALDRNGDGTITPDELAVLVIANSKPDEGQSGEFSGRAFPIPGQGLTFASSFAVVGEGGSFASLNHELFHRIAPHTVDLYGHPQRCFGLHFGTSLMAATIVRNPDARRTFHPDPWNKMRVGWTEPRLYSMDTPGRVQLAAQHVPLSKAPEHKRPVLLYDTRKGSSEYFLLEYRTPNASGYDRNVADSGLMIWHVLQNSAQRLFLLDADRKNCKDEVLQVWSLNVRGAPDWQIGVTRAYTAAHNSIALKWMSGDDSGVRVKIEPHKPIDLQIDVSWTVPPAVAPLSVIKVAEATYGGNCGAPSGNMTSVLAKSCGGRTSCTFKIDYKVIGDPKPGCAKDFKTTWHCGSNNRRDGAPPEAGSGREIYLFC